MVRSGASADPSAGERDETHGGPVVPVGLAAQRERREAPRRGGWAALLIVGDEVLSGEVRDENGPWLIARLSSLGTRVVRVSVVPDRVETIVSELRVLRGAADVVVTSGGIGPTHDDLTRQA